MNKANEEKQLENTRKKRKFEFPLTTRKKLNFVKNNLKVMNETKMKLNHLYIEKQIELMNLNKKYKDLDKEYNGLLVLCEKQGYDIEDLKKEIKRLKTLCTKNGISYKKEEK